MKEKNENIYKDILDLLNKADIISFRILEPTNEDMEKMDKLYKLGIVNAQSKIIYGTPKMKISGRMNIGNRLGELNGN